MADNTKIQWADATVNFWQGCKKVSQGCKFCYMFRDFHRFKKDPTNVIRSGDKTFNKALTWDEPRLIFTNSLSDFFIKEADEWRDEAWDVIRRTPQHNWLILTKRPERIKMCLPVDWGKGWDNVWLGVSIENNKTLHRIKHLLEIPAKVRFLSMEPLLEQIDITPFLMIEGPKNEVFKPIDWVIVGGESGNDNGEFKYRLCSQKWIEGIVNQCMNYGVPVFMKQLGTHLAKQYELSDRHGGKFEDERFPPYLKVREFPKQKK
jgi:protein gp37